MADFSLYHQIYLAVLPSKMFIYSLHMYLAWMNVNSELKFDFALKGRMSSLDKLEMCQDEKVGLTATQRMTITTASNKPLLPC
jgi:hypothetical protein